MASSPRRALPLPLRRLTRAPLFRTLGFAGRAMAMPVRSSPAPPHGFVRELFKLRLFHGPGELSADRAPAPKTPPFPRHRRFCRSAPPSGAGKIVRAFPKAAEAAPPSTNVFRRCGALLMWAARPHRGRYFPHAQDGQLIERRLIRFLPRPRSYSSVRSQDEPAFPKGATPHSATFPFFSSPLLLTYFNSC